MVRRMTGSCGVGRTRATVATVTIAVLTLVWLVDYVDRAVVPLALPAINRDLKIGMAGAVMVLTVYYFLYAALQVPGGILADRLGARRTWCWPWWDAR